MSELYAVDVAVDFIDAVASHAEERLRDEGHLTVLFPNRRAVRFFERRLASPLLLRVTAAALEDFAKEAVYAHADPPPHYQLDIDRYFMIYDILRAHPTLYQRLGGSMEHVFPWCAHLSNLFDEFDQHLIASVTPLQYMESVIPEAREILANLNVLYRDYRQVMRERNLTFYGDIFRRLNGLKEELSGPFVLAGFALLTGSQKSFFLHLFREHDTSVFFHTDLKKRHPVANPYRLYADWMRGALWGVKPKVILGEGSVPEAPEITFHESFDTHAEISQVMAEMAEDMTGEAKDASPLDTGIILPESSALFPLLYGLSAFDRPMNVTLGFPFEKSVFSRLLDTFIDLSLTRHERRGFHHAPLLRLLSHPFVQAIRVGKTLFEASANRLRDIIVSRNLTFVRFEDLKPAGDFSENDVENCRRVDGDILRPFVTATTLRQVGNVLKRLILGFREALSADPAYALERQMARSFLDQVLPNLTHSQSADRTFNSPKILCRALKSLVTPIHLPFEGDPLKGVQVMGVLESRLLNFRRLFILDVNEGILPKSSKIDPLLPTSLHPLVGLPAMKKREALFQYYFFRLVDGARQAHIFYQNGITGDDKRIRSRFVEQLLLEREMETNPADNGVEALEANLVNTYSFHIPPTTAPGTTPPPFYRERIDALLNEKLSPTLLDMYLACPHQFYLQYVLNMETEESVEESQSPLEVGTMIHNILHEAFKGAQQNPLTPEIIREAREASLREIAPTVHRNFSNLSPLRRNLLIHLAKFRLAAFFELFEGEVGRFHRVRITETEKPLSATLSGYEFRGRADRIDEIIDAPVAPARWRIIDYKTGKSAEVPSRNLGEFLEAFDFSDYSLTALSDLKRALRSTQLPLYLTLFKRMFPRRAENVEASLLLIGSPGGVITSKAFQDRDIPTEKMERIFLYLVNHMRESKAVAPHSESPCQFCPYLRVCKHANRSGVGA